MAETLTAAQAEEERARARRQARKNAKKRHAAARDAFLNQSTGFVDREALHASLELLMAREGLNFDDEDAASSSDAASRPRVRAMAMGAPAPMAFPASNTNRWNPIGPSAVRRGQADGRPRVSGRVRDLAVSGDGQRAYAGTAKGGVIFALAEKMQLPIRFIGVGEGIDDLRPFSAPDFIQALFEPDEKDWQ